MTKGERIGLAITIIVVIIGCVLLANLLYSQEVEKGKVMYLNCYQHGELVYSERYTRENYLPGAWKNEHGYQVNGYPERPNYVCGYEYYGDD